jgi:16S rRNA (cytosine1402-N4)-methyltransferase
MAHVPVLLHEAVEGLDLREGDTVLDATAGSGGHTKEICQKIGETGTIVAIDQDPNALKRTEAALAGTKCKKIFLHGNFRNLDTLLASHSIGKIDGALFDLGFSSEQIESSGRGFSFLRNEPLLMTMDETGGKKVLTAGEIVNFWSKERIEQILKEYGEERNARAIAKAIVEARKVEPIATTAELVEIMRRALPKWALHQRTHFATKTFQALRIAVNDELGALGEGLRKTWDMLGGKKRMAVITFHSLEDRIVKNFFKEKKANGLCAIITKKPIIPSRDELKNNPRARSAKLRIGEKI